jgi:hypothetical protein
LSCVQLIAFLFVIFFLLTKACCYHRHTTPNGLLP